jgi:hypothetical protein
MQIAKRLACLILAIGAGATLVACSGRKAAFTQVFEARRLGSELRVQFTKATEASDRVVMSEGADASSAADEARRARQHVERDEQALRWILGSAGYRDDVRYVDEFRARFDEYRRLDDEALSLALDNTNARARQLSFGPAREAAAAFGTSLDTAVRTGAATPGCPAALAATRAHAALLEIQAMYAPHIAEADDAAMTRMERQMTESAAAARKGLAELRALLSPASSPSLAAAAAALDRFMSIHAEIVTLSRRNSNVRSLALSLGRKRLVAADCEDRLRALEEALAKHEFTATR